MGDFLEPQYMWVGVGRVGNACTSVEQRFNDASTTDDNGKFDMLMDAMEDVSNEDGGMAKTIIFANAKYTVDDVSWRLSDSQIRTAQIHGGMTQAARDRAISDLKRGTVRVLVATDVAARGLDLPGIDHVINYELPKNAEDYVHRIGRTGRIGNVGVATSFVTSFEPALRDIVQQINTQIEEEGQGRTSPVPRWLEDQAMRSKTSRPMNAYSSSSTRNGSGYSSPRNSGGYGSPRNVGRHDSARGGRYGYASDDDDYDSRRFGRNFGSQRDGRYGSARDDGRGRSYGSQRDGRYGSARNDGRGRGSPQGRRPHDEPNWARNLPPRRRF